MPAKQAKNAKNSETWTMGRAFNDEATDRRENAQNGKTARSQAFD